MDALKLLKQDHKVVKELFEKVDSMSDRALKAKRLTVDKIIAELSIHAQIEEKIFYPSIRSASAEIESVVLESFEEHAIGKRLLSELKTMSAEDERFDAKVTVLKEMVEHHVEEEEDELFPKVRRAMDAKALEALGQKLEQAKHVTKHKSAGNGHSAET
ncbi:MAG: hemerythrin domain-containing protein [Polyangiales bacterium]